MQQNNLKYFESGAIRSTDADSVRYDLITPIGLRRLAETYAEGANKYGHDNWLHGIPASDLFNHTIRHLYLWLAGDKSEDHLAHAAWNIFTMMHFEETRPELIDILYANNDNVPQKVTSKENDLRTINIFIAQPDAPVIAKCPICHTTFNCYVHSEIDSEIQEPCEHLVDDHVVRDPSDGSLRLILIFAPCGNS